MIRRCSTPVHASMREQEEGELMGPSKRRELCHLLPKVDVPPGGELPLVEWRKSGTKTSTFDIYSE
jgi:hypothetical protein